MEYWLKDSQADDTTQNNNSNNAASSTKEVKGKNNKVYFYSPVDDNSILKFQEALDEAVDRSFSYANLNRVQPAPIYIHINSGGGSVFAGLAAMDIIERCAAETVSVVEGRAASAATLMSVAANRRLITPRSFMLIHQLSSGMWGTYENLKDHQENIENLMEMIRGAYVDRTRLSRKMLDEMLKRDLYFPAERCIKLGLADEVYGV